MLSHNRLIICCALTGALSVALLTSCSSMQPTSQPNNDTTNAASLPSEGMWLMPQIKQQAYPQMKAQGISVDANAIYHPDSTAMNRAIVRINNGQTHTGSGSFVSDEGLILTNYSAAYPATAAASSKQQNLLANGFYANSKAEEISAPNFRLYILMEQNDVTDTFTKQLGDSLRYRQRQQRAQQLKEKLIAQRKAEDANIAVTINDIMGGNRQLMSVYRVIQDVRIVHLPSSSVANMGGHMGSWNWPRHSGDYAFLRAYVGPNGESRAYDQANVPFSPDTHLDIDRRGVSKGDFTFSLGFPGQTSRYTSSYSMQFYRDHQFPVITKAYRAILDGLQHTAAQDSQAAIENANRRESIANTLQYYQSAQRGFREHDIVASKQRTEQAFQKWIKQDSLRNIRYRRVLSQLDQAYGIAAQTGDLLYANIYTLNNLRLFEITDLYHSYRQIIADSSQQDIRQAYKDSLLDRHQTLLNDINIEGQQITLAGMLEMLATLPEGNVMFHLIDLFGDARGDSLQQAIRQYLDKQQQESIIYNVDRAKRFLELPIDSARAQPVDDMLKLYRALIDSYQFSRKNYLQHIPYRNPARELYVEGMQKFKDNPRAYPDANGTLRLSMGTVQGYSPQDGIYYQPKTTLQGLLTKVKGSGNPMPRPLQAYGDSTRSANNASNNPLTINFLTTSDITGGSEGSPVLNRNGQIVGITYNNTLEGVVGDYRYQQNIKRAINLDISYVLFLMEELTDDNRLMQEMELLDSKQAP